MTVDRPGTSQETRAETSAAGTAKASCQAYSSSIWGRIMAA